MQASLGRRRLLTGAGAAILTAAEAELAVNTIAGLYQPA
jgi:hypothetical protein